MKHFSMLEWIDFARQTGEPERANAMQEHLDQGCIRCSKNVAVWRRIVNFATEELKQEPAGSSLHLVKASFALRKIAAFETGNVELAMLVSDSAQSAAAGGFRGATASPRQLLYKSGTVCIDMYIQPRPGSESIVLTGQLMDSMKPNQGIGGVSVSLVSGGNTVSHKETNNFGEFDFGLESPRDVQLAFGLDNNCRTLVVPVPDRTA
jgi:hypothetical protein